MSSEVNSRVIEEAHANLELSLQSNASDRTHLGNLAIVGLLGALLLEVAELRNDLANISDAKAS